MVNSEGIPWQGKVPSDVKHFREQTEGGVVLMGYGTYAEFDQPLPNRRNLVATNKGKPLRDGFELVKDARAFLRHANQDVWVIGGLGLFTNTLDLAEELDLTLIERDFQCSKFFPEYAKDFEVVERSQPITENGITFRFVKLRRSKPALLFGK